MASTASTIGGTLSAKSINLSLSCLNSGASFLKLTSFANLLGDAADFVALVVAAFFGLLPFGRTSMVSLLALLPFAAFTEVFFGLLTLGVGFVVLFLGLVFGSGVAALAGFAGLSGISTSTRTLADFLALVVSVTVLTGDFLGLLALTGDFLAGDFLTAVFLGLAAIFLGLAAVFFGLATAFAFLGVAVVAFAFLTLDPP